MNSSTSTLPNECLECEAQIPNYLAVCITCQIVAQLEDRDEDISV